MIALELVVILGVAIVACGVISERTGIASPILLLVVGVLLGFIPALREIHLPPEVMLLVFLPALLFWEAIATSLREIRANLRGIVLNSTVLVVVTAAAVAATAHALGLSWGASWVLGAALAPTDATAVGALARALPNRNVTLLRAESLVNDGTALVLYGIAVGVTVGEETLTAGHLTWLVALSYIGGASAGALVAWLGLQVRRRLDNSQLNNVVTILIPFAAFLAAEAIGASGVLAVVASGLIVSQVGPRIVAPATRRQAHAFWSLGTFLLNASLFVLVGIELQSAVRSLSSTDLVTALTATVVVWIVVIAVRIAFLFAAAHLIRLIDRRPQQRLRRVSGRARIVSGVAGFRGAVSLAAALAVPTTLGAGAPFPDRDLIIFITAGVVALTLVIQGALLLPTIRWAKLPEDTSPHAERHLADVVALESALEALPGLATELGVDPDLENATRQEYQDRLEFLRLDGETPEAQESAEQNQRETALRLALLKRKKAAVVDLRDARRIDDSVLRAVQHRLDLEELRLIGDDPDE